MEWYEKLESQKLSLMLKFSVIIKILLILASLFLRYFKAVCDKSEYTDLQLKNEIQEISLWLKMSFHKENWK